MPPEPAHLALPSAAAVGAVLAEMADDMVVADAAASRA
jgi:hypothetical protein